MAEASKAEYLVGVDLGGTKILSGIFKHSLECVGTAKVSTKSQRGVEAVVEAHRYVETHQKTGSVVLTVG